MKDRISKSFFWIAWSRVALQGVSFLSTLIVARLLHPADYGLMAIAGIWTYTVVSITELGLGAAIIQFPDIQDEELSACFWLAVGLAGLGYLSLYAFAPMIAGWFAAPRLSGVLRVLGLALPLAALRVVPDNLLRKRLQFDRVCQAEIISGVMTIPVVLGMAWTGAGVWALVVAALVSPATQTAVTFWFVWWWPTFRIGGPRFRQMIRYSLTLLGGRVCWLVFMQSDAFVLGKVSGDIVLGFYSMAKTIALLPVEKVSSIALQLAYPVMAELQTNQGGLRASFLRGLRLVTCTTWPMIIGLALVADDLVNVALGQKWVLIVLPLQLFCLYAVFLSVSTLFSPVMLARYRLGALARYSLLQLLLMPLAFLGGAWWGGGTGVALAWVSVYPILLCGLASRTFRELNITWRIFFGQLRPAAAATLLMALSVLGVRLAWSILGTDLIVWRLASAVLFGSIAYGIGVLWLGGSIRGEVKEVVGWVLRRSAEERTVASTKPLL